jgi:uncharacterized cupin superfamily protein
MTTREEMKRLGAKAKAKTEMKSESTRETSEAIEAIETESPATKVAGRRHPNVINLMEAEARPMSRGARFGCVTRLLGRAAGGRGVGASWYEVQPGRTAFPAHWHAANEEALFILEGSGTLRIGKETVAVREGDWVTFPPGPDFAHQLVNDGDEPLRYLCLSTLVTTEIVGYPDSGKVGVASVGGGGSPWMRALFRMEAQIADYYDRERVE